MKFNSTGYRLLLAGCIMALLTGCAAAGDTAPGTTAPDAASGPAKQAMAAAAPDEESHGKDAAPNYDVVFPQDSVNRIDITLSEQAWAELQAEMTEQFGEAGQGGGMGGGFPGAPGAGGRQNPPGLPPDGQPAPAVPGEGQQAPPGFPQDGQAPNDGRQPGGMGRGLDFGDTSYVEGTVTFNGQTWEHIGFRYSGNSTLQNSWRSGTAKISFRLDFDEFEDQYPATKDQRFYGFKQISFKSNAMDSSYIREKVVADLFREAGVVSPQTAFYEVYIDHGDGPTYFGLYTAVEIVDDTVIKTQFSDDSGNVYKPEGSGAAFVDGTFSEESFEKQTNEDEADWSDIQAMFAALNSDLRTSDPAAWRAGLEAVFDVDAFIRWLAVDTIIQNWDTYGAMAHNYYLYNDPSDGLLTWIPWDNNMALSGQGMGAGGRGGNHAANGPGGQGVRELDLSSVGEQWPLIRYLMDDPVYKARYRQDLAEVLETVWQPEKLAARYRRAHDLIAPYVLAEQEGYTQLESIDSFNSSVEALIEHAQQRYEAVKAYLAGE